MNLSMTIRWLIRSLGRQQWLRFGIRDRLARFVDNPDTTSGFAFRQPFFGGIYSGHTSNFIDWNAYYFGAYSRGELQISADCFPASTSPRNDSHGLVVLDVGANVGHHTLFYGLMGAKGLAFEPNPLAAELAHRKLQINHLGDSIQLDQSALSDHSGVMLLSLPDGCNLGMASLVKNVGAKTVDVAVLPGDYCRAIQQLQKIAWIKIDVEGHELAVLRGLMATLQQHRPLVLFEWNALEPFSEVMALFPEGYNFFVFISDQPLAVFFNRPDYRLTQVPSSGPAGVANLLAVPGDHLPQRLRRRLAVR